MLRHYNTATATATEYPMLSWRQDAVMILDLEEKHRSTIQWYDFQFSSVQRKSTAAFMLRLETAAAEIASVKLPGPHNTRLALLCSALRCKIQT